MQPSAPLFAFDQLLQRLVPGFDSGPWKLVRHLETRREAPDFAALVLTERSGLELYQQFQSSDIFGRCDGIFSFVGLPGRRALFFGAYRCEGRQDPVELDPDSPAVPGSMRRLWRRWCAEWPAEGVVRYRLAHDLRFAALEGRVVIDWGRGTLAWHQWSADKPVLELREPGRIGDCPAYPELEVSLQTLAFLAAHAEANPSWVDRLSSVGGIYLLTDHRSQRLYVGQAGGTGPRGGFWGRWLQYAAGASGNVAVDAAVADGSIRPADPELTLSVLEIVPLGKASQARLDELEIRWKRRLCTRGSVHGLNEN